MVTIVWPLLVTVAGALVYALTVNPKLNEMGRLLFAVGALWTTYLLCGKAFMI
jgi:hypothetical protein